MKEIKTINKLKVENLLSGATDINVLLCGEQNVGKSSIVMRYAKKKFDPFYIISIFVEEFNIPIKISNKTFNYQFYVTVGNEKYKQNYKELYKKCDVVIFVFDLTNKKSLEFIKRQKDDVMKFVKNPLVIFVGNKSDLAEREVVFSNVKKYCDDNSIEYFEVSAKSNTHIDRMFYKIADLFNNTLNN